MVSGGGQLSDLSLCLLHGPDSGQPFLVDLRLLLSTPDVADVFDSSGDSVKCHTDLTSCCSAAEGVHRGEYISLMELDCNFPKVLA